VTPRSPLPDGPGPGKVACPGCRRSHIAADDVCCPRCFHRLSAELQRELVVRGRRGSKAKVEESKRRAVQYLTAGR
jgi:hypothetical protein